VIEALSREHARPTSAKSSDPRVAGPREVDPEQLGCLIATSGCQRPSGGRRPWRI